jgi:endonuclease YncB( thermonuclease family)
MKVALKSAVLTALLVGIVFSSGWAKAGEVLAGPVSARVLSVIDGDTLDVVARVWLGQDVRIRVRIEGVDAPEIRGRCPGEKALAIAAKAFVTDQTSGRSINLTAIRYGKYAGRIVAEVVLDDGSSLGELLVI